MANATDCLWLKEATRGTYPSLTAMNYFGLEPEDNTYPLAMPGAININTIKTMGSRTATFTKGTSFPENTNVNYIPVNGLPEWMLLGTSSTADDVHTITAHATNAMPSFSFFQQGNAATQKRKSAGNICKSLQVLHKLGRPVTHNQSFDGITDAVSTDTPASNVFPSSIVAPFFVKTTFTANAAAYTYQEIAWTFTHPLSGIGNNSGKRRDYVDTEPIIVTCVANLTGDFTALTTLKDAGTGHTVVWKVSKADTTYYKQYSLTMYIQDISPKFRVDDATDYCVVTWIGSNPTVTCKDGVAASFYGE